MSAKANLVSVLCCILLLSAPFITLAQNEEIVPEDPNGNTSKSPVTTSVPTKASTSVPTKASTSVPTKASTSVPTKASTSVPTKASTSVPTKASTSVPTKASTSVPTKTSTSVPTKAPTSVPTKAPTPIPTTLPPYHPTKKPFPDNVGSWKENCVMVNAAFEIIVPVDYKNKTKQNETVPVPELAEAFGRCSSMTQSLSLNWTEKSYNNKTTLLNVLALEFVRDYANGVYRLIKVTYMYDSQQFGNINGTKTISADHLNYFETPVSKSYSCNDKASITYSDENGFLFQLNMANVQLEAFSSGSKFGTALQCKADEKPHKSKGLLIGLTVSFAVLFLAAGVGYFLWRRRRAQQGGYQSLDGYQ